MNDNESRYFQFLESQVTDLQNQKAAMQNRVDQTSAFNIKYDQSIAELQLEMERQLDRIYHLLRGDVLITDQQTGSRYWAEPEDDRLRILTKYGVDQIMNILSTYVDKSFVLSDYDDVTIMWKVRDFAIELNDLLHNRSEAFFYYPSPEEIYEKYLPLVRKYRLDITEDELYQKALIWSKEEYQTRIRHYPMIVQQVVDVVHNTYLRARKAKTLDSMRKMVNVSENVNNSSIQQMPTQKKGFSFFRRKNES